MINKRQKIGLVLMVSGFILSLLLYSFVFKEEKIYGFFKSDALFVIGGPIILLGALLFSPFAKRGDLKIGLFAKILLGILIVIWLAMSIGMIVGHFK